MDSFFRELLTVFWFFLPAAVANVTPIIVAKMPLLKRWKAPLDNGRSLWGIRVFGDHKTWRGVVTGSFAGGVICLLSYQFYPITSSEGLAFIMGCWIGLGALFGDAGKSFFKRRAGIASGKSWYVFDQVDYILGASLFTFWLVPLPWFDYLLGMVVWGGLSLIASYFGYLSGFKKSPI